MECSLFTGMQDPQSSSTGILGWIERVGNRLPDPVGIFIIGIFVVFVLSQIAVTAGWEVEQMLPRVAVEDGELEVTEWYATGEVFTARSLLTGEGLYWQLRTLVENFINFPPLGVVLVAMLGIGLADKTGLLRALLRSILFITPGRLLTPSMIFLGILSSMTLDAGYLLLIPLAGPIYMSFGRSPIAGIAAVFAGVSAGFNANLFLTSLDPLLAGFTETAARTIDSAYRVNPAANLYFMMVSTGVITLAGWAVSHWIVEPRLARSGIETGSNPGDNAIAIGSGPLEAGERRALGIAVVVFVVFFALCLFMALVPGMPLHGPGEGPFDRWVDAIVPLIFFGALFPGLAYGITWGTLRSNRDFARMLTETIATMAPIIVLAFFAAQFIEGFRYSGLDIMLATAGGQFLGQAELPRGVLIIAFIGFIMFFNLFIGSMSAKYAMLAPIFVPMLMVVGISPELTQVAYRIGDSVTNIITPLMPYLVIVLVFIRAYAPKAGLGTIISTMIPYSIVFSIVWCILLLGWMWLGWPLGPDGGLEYVLPQG